MKSKITLTFIFVIAVILRFYQLGSIPSGLYIDEPSLGYNAYTILKTGKDEYGVSFPLAFKAFGEYKLPGYIYATVPIIAIFGLSPFSIRFVSAIAGSIAVFAIYLLAKQLSFRNGKYHTIMPLIAALLWTLSPWNIQLSRAAFEANLMVTFVLFGIYFLLKYADKPRPINAMSSAVCLSAAMYTYNAARLCVPLLLIAYLCIYFRSLSKTKLIIPILIIALCSIPGAIGLIFNHETARIQQVFELGNKQYMLGPTLGFLQKYFTQFSADFLFFRGDMNSARHGVQELGELYLFEVITLVVGLYTLLASNSKHAKFIAIWLMVGPIPAGLSTPVPHALRASLMLPPLIIFSAVGLTEVINAIVSRIQIKFFRVALVAFTSLCIFYSWTSYLHTYYIHYRVRYSWDWNEHVTLVARYITEKYPDIPGKYLIEGDPKNIIYFKFFNAAKGRTTPQDKYTFVSSDMTTTPENGDVVAISGWKGAPEELKDLSELKMTNNSIGYKVGVYQR